MQTTNEIIFKWHQNNHKIKCNRPKPSEDMATSDVFFCKINQHRNIKNTTIVPCFAITQNAF